MALLNIAEIFGFDVTNGSSAARRSRGQKWCRFRNARCNKGNLQNPLGICSFGDGNQAGIVCPSRFLESDRMFKDAALAAFGRGARIIVAPEIRILRIQGQHSRKIGKVDYIIGRLDKHDEVCDFAALEVQAVYFSGRSIQPAFHNFLKTGQLMTNSQRRLDYRSSAQKRLMPQLNLKVPVFRRWGKKFFVAVDNLFYTQLPAMRTVPNMDNSEVTWLVYPFSKQKGGYEMATPAIHYTLWEDVLNALREGQAPTPGEIMAEISARRAEYRMLTV